MPTSVWNGTVVKKIKMPNRRNMQRNIRIFRRLGIRIFLAGVQSQGVARGRGIPSGGKATTDQTAVEARVRQHISRKYGS